MKIEYLEIKFDILSHQKMVFGDNFNVIYSKSNSKGKTTLIRAILFILGFKVNPTKGISFDVMEYKMIIKNCKDKRISISRLRDEDFKYVAVGTPEGCERCQYGEHYEWVQKNVFEGLPCELLPNILGVFYIDQEKGWTMLNRGKVIGSIKFNIENFLCALGNADVEDEKREVKKLDDEINQYKKLRDFNALLRDIDVCNGQLVPDSLLDNLYKREHEVKSEIMYIQKEYDMLKAVNEDNISYASFIDKLNLFILHDGKRIRVTKNNVEGLSEAQKLGQVRMKGLWGKLVELRRKYEELERERSKYESLYDTEDLLTLYKRKISSIHMSQLDIENAIKSLTDRRKELAAKIKEAAHNSAMSNIGKYVVRYLENMDVRYNYDVSKCVALTSDLYPYAGAEMSKRVLAFHLAYVTAIREKFGVRLPIIIDSPYSKEIDDVNFIRFLEIIRTDFSKHQVLIASIRKDQMEEYNLISLNEGLLDSYVSIKCVSNLRSIKVANALDVFMREINSGASVAPCMQNYLRVANAPLGA